MNYTYIDDLMPKLIEKNPRWNLFYQVKTNIKKEQLRMMKQAGIRWILAGVESFSTPILQLMRKGCNSLQNIQLLKWCSELGIHVVYSLITGFPNENPDDYEQMSAIIPVLKHLHPPIAIGNFRLDRFSPYFDNPELFGIVNIRPLPDYKLIYPFSDDVLSRLVCAFDFDYSDGRNLNYTRLFIDMVRQWQLSLSSWFSIILLY